MLRNWKRISLFRSRAGRGFWRRAHARLLLRTHSLSSYPWPMQFKPRLVFAVLLTRGQRSRAMQERAKAAVRRRGHEAPQRQSPVTRKADMPRLAQGSQPKAAPAQKSTSASTRATVRAVKAPQVLAARPAPGATTAVRATPRARASARATRPMLAAPALRARRDSFRRPPRRRTSTRFVAQRVFAAVDSTPVVRHAVMREAPVRHTAVTAQTMQPAARFRARQVSVASAHRNFVSVIERHVHLHHRRPARDAARGGGIDGVRSRRPRTPSPSSSRKAFLVRRSERASVSARPPSSGVLRERVVTVGSVRSCRPAPTAVVTSAPRSVRSVAQPSTAVARSVRTGVTSPMGIGQRSRRTHGRAAAALAHSRIRHGASARHQRFVFARERLPQRRSGLGRLPRREYPADGPSLVLRQRAGTAGLREQQRAAPRQAFVVRESRRAIPPGPSEPSTTGPQPAPVVEEVRRILIPLLQETLFSQGTMGRLASGVVTEVDRRDSAEQYRKSGGR
jgi:hypothetical protein